MTVLIKPLKRFANGRDAEQTSPRSNFLPWLFINRFLPYHTFSTTLRTHPNPLDIHNNKLINSWSAHIYFQDDLQEAGTAHLAIAHRAVQAGSIYPALFARGVSPTPTVRARQLSIVLPIWTNPGPQLPLLGNRGSIPATKKKNSFQQVATAQKQNLQFSKVLMVSMAKAESP